MVQESLRALAYLEKEFKEEPEPKKRSARAAQYIQPSVENFRRTKAGGRLVVQELRKILDTQCKMYPHKSFWNVDSTAVKFKDAKGDSCEICTSELMSKAPAFFSIYFASIRKKIQYGLRVQNWLETVS